MNFNSPNTRSWCNLGSLLAVKGTFPRQIVVFGIKKTVFWAKIDSLVTEHEVLPSGVTLKVLIENYAYID